MSCCNIYAIEIGCKAGAEKRNVAVNFSPVLESLEQIADGTITVVEIDTSDLVIDDIASNTNFLEISGQTVTAKKAVTFSVDGGLVGRYSIQIAFTSTDTVPQEIVRRIWLDVVEPLI